MKAFGIAPVSVERVFANPQGLIHGEARSKSLLINDNPYNKCYMNLERDWFKVQLLAPELLQELQDKYYHFLGESLAWDHLSSTYVLSSKSWTDSKTISLKGFSRHTVSHCSTSTFFGTKLLQVAPSFAQDYEDFEEESWKIFYRLPPFLVKKSHIAKAKAIDGLVKYLSLPEEERSELAWIFRTMNIELRYLSLPPRDVAGIIMIIIWASVCLKNTASIPHVPANNPQHQQQRPQNRLLDLRAPPARYPFPHRPPRRNRRRLLPLRCGRHGCSPNRLPPPRRHLARDPPLLQRRLRRPRGPRPLRRRH